MHRPTIARRHYLWAFFSFASLDLLLGWHAAALKRRIAFTAVLVSALVLTFFVIAGEVILKAINIPLTAFQIAGGIVLFLFALTMIFGESKPESEVQMTSKVSAVAIFPLAMPSIASPGAILAAVLQTENEQFGLIEQFITTGIMISVLMVVLILLLLASTVQRLIGDAGASVISRVMGLILASVAVANVLEGIKTYFVI